MAGLPETSATRKRRNKVPHSPTPSHPLAGLFKQPLNPSDSDYQESPPASGDSSTTQLPPWLLNRGKCYFSSSHALLQPLNLCILLYLHIHRAKAKKRKTGESSLIPENLELEDPILVTPEGQREAAKDQADENVDPPKQNEPPTTEEVNTQGGAPDVLEDINPPSLIRLSSPTKATEDIALSSPQIADEVTITGASFKAPEPSTVLTKLATKDDPVAAEKGKTKLELPMLEELSAADIHVLYLTRLSTSREMEANMVNMLKRKYEVNRVSSF
jgi:hypothetical protein